jgi:hypothetical protein
MNNDYKCSVCGVAVDGMDAFMIRESGLCFTHYNEGPGKTKRAIREEDKLDEAWYRAAREVRTTEQLTAFMNHVMNGYTHDYGTVCKAVAACALAAAWCADRTPGGGITGFQAGAVFWEFARQWLHIEGAARLIKYKDMLYPQNADRFSRTLDKRTAEWLRDEAKKKLADGAGAHPNVKAHWEALASGELPFGYTLNAD